MKEVKGQILFIEEDQDTCYLISTLLKYAGYQTTVSQNVEEGLRLAKTNAFDLILLDWCFEDTDGVDLCRRIREFDGDTPVFLYTGVAYKPELHQAMEAGAQGYFVQPLDVSELLDSHQHSAENDGANSKKKHSPIRQGPLGIDLRVATK